MITGNVTVIGNSAFYGCRNLEKIVISKSVDTIGYNAFYDTKWLANKKATAKNVVVVNGIAIARANNIYESVNLKSVKEIHPDIFRGYYGIKEFVISDGTEIGDNALFTGSNFNICLKHNNFYINIPINRSEIQWNSFNKRTTSLFDFIGEDMEQAEILFDDLEISQYRYPIALFMANAYKSEFFKTFIKVHLNDIIRYAETNNPDLLKLINNKYQKN
ncbi:MAG: leucine-rich repeat domain-containing protein [Ruminococcus sp.]|nr:leucine-rich repeat domain-containing protein [Ruminococcus sp.]